MTALSRALRTARIKHNLTYRGLYKRSGVANGYICHLESGREKLPTPLVLRKLARALELNHIDLMVAAGYLTRKELRAYTLTGLRMVECKK